MGLVLAHYHTVDISIVRIGLINLDILQSCAAEHHHIAYRSHILRDEKLGEGCTLAECILIDKRHRFGYTD